MEAGLNPPMFKKINFSSLFRSNLKDGGPMQEILGANHGRCRINFHFQRSCVKIQKSFFSFSNFLLTVLVFYNYSYIWPFKRLLFFHTTAINA